MLAHLQLVAYSARNRERPMEQIPMSGELQEALQNEWGGQLREFLQGVREVEFDAGYKPEADERFVVKGFVFPRGMEAGREGLDTLGRFQAKEESLRRLSALFAYAKAGDREVVMIQRFARSHIIQPGRFLFIEQDTFKVSSAPALTLGTKPDAVYFPAEQKLVFANFRNANAILPLGDFYEEASETDIRRILAHPRIVAENPDELAVDASQWFRTRFSMLRDSGVLDAYTPAQIRSDAIGYVDIETRRVDGEERIVFPANKTAAKRLLQFLNEELYRGPITEKVYETNSKRTADAAA